jgi:hypothetical protein
VPGVPAGDRRRRRPIAAGTKEAREGAALGTAHGVARRLRRGGPAMQWAVAHRVRLGGRSALAPRLVITDVPEEVGRATLRSALVAGGYAVSLSEAGVAFF